MPRREAEAFLSDIIVASGVIAELAKGVDFDAYKGNIEKRSAIERQLLIVGEATYQLRQAYPRLAAKLTHADKIVGFRHILIHGYSCR